MRLVNKNYQLDIVLKENKINLLIVEDPIVYTSLVNDLWVQYNGGTGSWILSDKDKTLNIYKNIKYIINPFSIDINEKSVITKLYQELKDLSDENLLLESSNINSSIVHYLDRLAFLTPYPLLFNVDFNLLSLLKMYDMKLDTNSNSLLERIVEYLKVLHLICHINIFIFVGLKQYLSIEQLKQLYEFVCYEKVSLVLFESKQYEILKEESIFIIDKDQCIINIDDNE